MHRRFVIGYPDKENVYALLIACSMVQTVERLTDAATLELCALKNTLGQTRAGSGVCHFHDCMDLNQVLLDAVAEVLHGDDEFDELDQSDSKVCRFLNKVQDTFYGIVEGHFKC